MYEQLLIGQILKAHGLKGEVKIKAFADDLSRFNQLKEVTLEDRDGKALDTLRIKRARIVGRDVYLTFWDIADRNAAEELRGKMLSVPREKAQKLAANSWYVCDLVGLDVYEGDTPLGKIKEVLDTGSQDLLVIAQAGERDLYVPFMEHLLVDVDLQEGTMRLELPDGLLEIYRES